MYVSELHTFCVQPSDQSITMTFVGAVSGCAVVVERVKIRTPPAQFVTVFYEQVLSR